MERGLDLSKLSEVDEAILLRLYEAFPDIRVEEISGAYVETGLDPARTVDMLVHFCGGCWFRKSEIAPEQKPRAVRKKKKNKPRQPQQEHEEKRPPAVSDSVVSGPMDFRAAVLYGKTVPRPQESMESQKRAAEDFLCSIVAEGSDLQRSVVVDVLEGCAYDVPRSVDLLLEMTYESSVADDDSSSDENYIKEDEAAANLAKLNVSRDVLRVLYAGTEAAAAKRRAAAELVAMEDECSLADRRLKQAPRASFDSPLKQAPCRASSANPSGPASERSVYRYCRASARQYWEFMRKFYGLAAEAYACGNGGHAHDLAEQGRNFRDCARRADAEGGDAIFGIRNRDLPIDTIDLHNLYVREAIGRVKERLQLLGKNPAVRRFNVITGSGSHGCGRGRIKVAVSNLLERSGLSWEEENPGKLVVPLHPPNRLRLKKSGLID